jgi:hypothetical protein
VPDSPKVSEGAISAPQSPGARRLSFGSQPGSSSSRSTSFNLADAARNGIRASEEHGPDEIGEDEEMDEEGMNQSSFLAID